MLREESSLFKTIGIMGIFERIVGRIEEGGTASYLEGRRLPGWVSDCSSGRFLLSHGLWQPPTTLMAVRWNESS